MKVWAWCAAAAAVATVDAETLEGVGVDVDGEVEAFDWHRDERLQGRALDTAEFYHTQELPMYTEFLANCQTDISQHCNSHSNHHGYVNEWWSCLEETNLNDLLPKCKQFIKFGHNGANPNPAFFEKVFDCKDIDDLNLGLGQPISKNCFVGYLKAPLFQGQPASSPITQTWYLVAPATTQPAPKGMLVQHNGGPSPGIGDNIFMYAADESTTSRIYNFPEDAAYINANYDVVFTDLRGMGLSSLRYKMNLDPAAMPARDFFLTYLNLESLDLKIGSDPAFNEKDVPMVLQQVGDGPVNRVTYSGRCADLVYPTGPTDWTSLSLVHQFTKAHGQYLAACTKKYTFPDGLGGTYTTFQHWGTSAAAWDLESLRQAFGSPDITLLGYSYGTRYVAAYASSFPKKIVRAVVTGTVNPSPDAAVVADYTARNVQNIFTYIAGQCELADDCDVDMMGVARAAYEMSLDESAGFQKKCCGFASQATLAGLYRSFLVGTPGVPGIPYPKGDYIDNFPVNFGILPWVVSSFAGDAVCKYTALPQDFDVDSAQSPRTFDVIPSLDMVGRTDAFTLAEQLVAVATKTPIGVSMALQYMQSTYGWRTEPVPIGFANNDVPMLIANTLYDERTSIENAQMYRTNFANSRIITAQAGGHCITAENSNECNNLMANFLLGRSTPEDGYVCENRGTIDFAAGKAAWDSSELKAQLQSIEPPVCKKCNAFKTAMSCTPKDKCRWNFRMKKCINKKK